MNRLRVPISLILAATTGLLFLGDSPKADIVILRPSAADSVSHDQGVLFIVSALKESVPNLLLSTQWGFDQYIDLNVQGAKESFPKTFYKLIPSNATIQKVTFEFRT